MTRNNANVAFGISSKPAKKVNKTSEMLEKISSNTVNANLDDVLKTVRQLDNICDFGRCRTKTSLIGQDCTLCEQRFCLKHQLPEVSITIHLKFKKHVPFYIFYLISFRFMVVAVLLRRSNEMNS